MTFLRTKIQAKRLIHTTLLVIGFVGLTSWWFVPISSGFTKAWLLAALAALWMGVLGLGWARKSVRWIVLSLPVLILGALMLPSRQMDRDALRNAYVKRMRSFEGTRYYWGGEGRNGIDCSGLPRRAFRDALLAEGVKHPDGAALRSAVEQWWFDASAKALSEGYRGYARPLGITGTVRSIDPTSLLPGDMAITADGVHVVIYVGEGHWIQADPGTEKVLTLDPLVSDNGWFDKKVAMYRWAQLGQ